MFILLQAYYIESFYECIDVIEVSKKDAGLINKASVLNGKRDKSDGYKYFVVHVPLGKEFNLYELIPTNAHGNFNLE